MKKILFTTSFLIFASVRSGHSAEPQFLISEKGPHHRVWSKIAEEQLPNGGVIKRVKSYTEISSGLHYWSDEQKDWLESSDQIEVINGVGVAQHGQHQVIWAANANTPGAVDLQSADGKRFRSHILGLAFTDAKTGASSFFGTIQDSIGEVVGNQVFYKNAFSGIKADIVYTYKREKFEQDIVLREALPDPSGPPWNFNPDTVLVEIYTEFIDVPEPVVESVMLPSEVDPALRQGMVEPDFIDQRLDFGAMKIGPGSAFGIGIGEGVPIPIAKSFEVREQRRVLIEKLQYSAAKRQLAALGKPAPLIKSQVAKIEQGMTRDKNGAAHSSLPKPPRLAAKMKSEPMRTAQIATPSKGYYLDYSQVNTSSNLTLKADSTYYVSGLVNLTGTTTIEGGCVVKYAPTNSASIKVSGSLVCLTGPMRMAVFTARDDHTIGEQIGTNALSGYYATNALELASTVTLSYARISYATVGVQFTSPGSGSILTHSQIVNCYRGAYLYNSSTFFRNVLACSLNTMITGTGSGAPISRWENVTVDRIQSLNPSATCNLLVTNSLLIGIVNTPGMFDYSGAFNATSTNSGAVFQTIGGGSHYLATNSPYRDIGTTNINVALLAQLQKKTTYPPLIRTNAVTVNTTWSQQAQRDTDILDLGYHYDPIDYVCDTVLITNATLTLGTGTCVGGYGANPLMIEDGGQLISEGTPITHNAILRYNCSQEQATNWGAAPSTLVCSFHSGTNRPIGRFRFTDFLTPNSAGNLLNAQSASDYSCLSLRDCELFSGIVYLGGSSNSFSGITNNLFYRTSLNFFGDSHLEAYNNLFYREYCYTENLGSLTNWIFKDNAFDGCTVDDAAVTTNGFNAYINTSGYLSPGPANGDLVLTNFTYATGPLGYFYQYSTNLVDKGSVTNAGLRGLYHYTTQTNQVKEANSRLDVGYHYVAGDFVTGVPLDFDGDGIPDYLEDLNGNGIFDAGETDWKTYNSPNGIVSGAGLQVFTPLK